jgi:hypothetical protein
MMNLKLFVAGTAVAVAATIDPALAAASDYAFESVKREFVKGDDVMVAVRLVDKRSGKPVPGAVIIRTRMDMAPDGMANMAVPVQPVRATEPDTYAFKADLSMAGRWQLSLAAKVQGEPETVMGKVVLVVKK